MDTASSFIDYGLKVLHKNPDSIIFAPLASAYRRQGSFQKALNMCELGLEKHPQYAQGHAVLGCIYLNLKRYSESITAFERALDLEPGHLLSLRYLIGLYIRFKDVKKLLRIYETLLIYSPQSVHVQDMIDKIHSAHLEDYGYFSEKSLEEAAEELSQRELNQKPLIRPLKCKAVEEEPEKLDQILNPVSRVSQKKIFPSAQAERERRLKILRGLIRRVNSFL